VSSASVATAVAILLLARWHDVVMMATLLLARWNDVSSASVATAVLVVEIVGLQQKALMEWTTYASSC